MSESFSELFENSEIQQNVKPGVLLMGTVVRINREKAIINVGLKSEGFISLNEFPDASFKVFLTAEVSARAKRRLKQLQESGIAGNISHTLAEVQKRDERDVNRQHSPLRPAKDALVIDTTNLTINEVITRVMALIKA